MYQFKKMIKVLLQFWKTFIISLDIGDSEERAKMR